MCLVPSLPWGGSRVSQETVSLLEKNLENVGGPVKVWNSSRDPRSARPPSCSWALTGSYFAPEGGGVPRVKEGRRAPGPTSVVEISARAVGGRGPDLNGEAGGRGASPVPAPPSLGLPPAPSTPAAPPPLPLPLEVPLPKAPSHSPLPSGPSRAREGAGERECIRVRLPRSQYGTGTRAAAAAAASRAARDLLGRGAARARGGGGRRGGGRRAGAVAAVAGAASRAPGRGEWSPFPSLLPLLPRPPKPPRLVAPHKTTGGGAERFFDVAAPGAAAGGSGSEVERPRLTPLEPTGQRTLRKWTVGGGKGPWPTLPRDVSTLAPRGLGEGGGGRAGPPQRPSSGPLSLVLPGRRSVPAGAGVGTGAVAWPGGGGQEGGTWTTRRRDTAQETSGDATRAQERSAGGGGGGSSGLSWRACASGCARSGAIQTQSQTPLGLSNAIPDAAWALGRAPFHTHEIRTHAP